MLKRFQVALALTAVCTATGAFADATVFQYADFGGPALEARHAIGNLRSQGFNNQASSVIVRGERWELCEEPGFRGHCVVLRPGGYPSLRAMGINNQVSSMRAVSRNARFDDRRYAPPPVYVDYRRRPDEATYRANVVEARAVVGPPERRCWAERERVGAPQPAGPNVPGAVAGAVIGGILGHQVGGGFGQDIATVGGVVAGAAIGSQIGGAPPRVSTRPVEHCANVDSSARPDYWDVVYDFRGVRHRAQLESRPGPTIAVNAAGEPRWTN